MLSITKDNNNNLWIGGDVPRGFLQVYDPIKRQSVSSFDFQLTSILDIQVKDSITWVLFQDGQDNGLMKFIYDEKWEYRDSFRNYPEEIRSINCFSLIDTMIFLGTNEGAYILQRADGTGNHPFHNHIGQFSADVTTAHDKQVVPGSTYRYRVYALCPSTSGPKGTGLSNTITVQIPSRFSE